MFLRLYNYNEFVAVKISSLSSSDILSLLFAGAQDYSRNYQIHFNVPVTHVEYTVLEGKFYYVALFNFKILWNCTSSL